MKPTTGEILHEMIRKRPESWFSITFSSSPENVVEQALRLLGWGVWTLFTGLIVLVAFPALVGYADWTLTNPQNMPWPVAVVILALMAGVGLFWVACHVRFAETAADRIKVRRDKEIRDARSHGYLSI
jgi:hypothetical protein